MRSIRTLLAGLGLLLFGALPAAAEVVGTVVTAEDAPVPGARVEAEGVTVTTDDLGRFSFPTLDQLTLVRVEHPRFKLLETELDPASNEPLLLVLRGKNQVFEEISVTATRDGDAGFHPVSVAVATVTAEDRPEAPSTVVGLVEGTPGVAMSGQGGQFQAFSIRGVAGQRVTTLVGGVRIVTERRAGATASFLDPGLLSSAEVVRGPSSSYYGSGALGGLVQLFPRRFGDTAVNVGWQSEGQERFVQIGTGWNDWSLGFAYRGADDSETADGEQLFSRFEQFSATLQRTWELAGGSTLELTAIPTVGRDIGKPNARFPARTTLYPEENHLIARLALRTPKRWLFDFWIHPNELLTRDVEEDSRALVDNNAFDYGVSAQRDVAFESGLSARLGVDYYGRRGVSASERTEDLETGEVSFATSLDGRQDELGAYASLRRTFSGVTVETGGRFTQIEQSNADGGSASKSAVTGFLGATVPLGGGFELAANVATGFRFAGLSERFFTGTTGRGEVVANADLDPERSLSLDLGMRYFGERLHVELFAFRNEIDDYIERIRLDNGARTFVNLTSGTIEGFELGGFFLLRDGLRLTWGGQRARGDDNRGAPLGDIPADRLNLGLLWKGDVWGASGRLEHRLEKDRIGSGEQPTSSADLLSASVTRRLGSDVRLTLSGTNLLDESYLPTADDLAVPATGRSIGLAAGWGW